MVRDKASTHVGAPRSHPARTGGRGGPPTSPWRAAHLGTLLPVG